MRYYHIWSLALALALGACSQYEEMPSGKDYAATVITQQEQEIISLLRSSEYGWSLILIPDEGNHGGINLSMKFISDKEATIASEEYGETVEVPKDPKNPGAGTEQIYQTEFTSNYHFSHNSGLRLTFDTYNKPLNYYSTPDWGIPNGYNGDYEFIVDKVSPDKDVIYLTGCRTGNKMQMIRLKGDTKAYLEGTKVIKQAVTGKALAPLKLGGKTVALSIFGLARQLWVRYDDKSELLPFYYTDKGIKLIKPLTLGGETLEGLTLDKDKATMTPLHGGSKLALQVGKYDLTKKHLYLYFYEGYASNVALDAFKTANEIQRTDTYKGLYEEYIDLGLSPGISRPSMSLTLEKGIEGLSKGFRPVYYMDFTSIYSEPNQFHTIRIIQYGSTYFYARRAQEFLLEYLVYYSPYTVTDATDAHGYHWLTSPKDNDEFWCKVESF